MIKINKSQNADSRTMTGEPNKEVLLKSSIQHIGDVQKGMCFMANKILEAGINHDHTKISGIDDFFDSYSRGLTNDEFKAEKWYQSHLTERHHLLDRCPDDVTLVDVIERIVDITMAGMARSGIVFDTEIPDEMLQKAFKNTIELLKSQIEIAE